MPCQTPGCKNPAAGSYCDPCSRALAAQGSVSQTAASSVSSGSSHAIPGDRPFGTPSASSSVAASAATSSSAASDDTKPTPATAYLIEQGQLTPNIEFLLVGSDNTKSSYVEPVLRSFVENETRIPNCLASYLAKDGGSQAWSWPINESWLISALKNPGLRACYVRNDYCEPALRPGAGPGGTISVDEFSKNYKKKKESSSFKEVQLILQAGFVQVSRTTFGGVKMTRLEKPTSSSAASSSSTARPSGSRSDRDWRQRPVPSAIVDRSPHQAAASGSRDWRSRAPATPLIAPGEGPGFAAASPTGPKEDKA